MPRLVHLGLLNSLSQALVKVASPGVPDFYQGTELWDFSLVDPDNRRPVEFGVRARSLAELEKRPPKAADLLANLSDGRAKLHADIAHPINADCRQKIQDRIVHAFKDELERSKLPGYKPVEMDEPDDYVPEEVN
jgi:maltooligosyltrehalose synthase